MFGGEFEEFDEIGAKPKPRIVFSQAVARVVQFGFAQGVEFAFRAMHEADFAFKKKIKHACKTALWAECTFGDGFDFAVIESEPGDDETRIAESRFTQENGAGGFQILSDDE